jgi:hypothetical protein
MLYNLNLIFSGDATVSACDCEQLVRDQSRLETSNQDRDFSLDATTNDDQVEFAFVSIQIKWFLQNKHIL